MNILGKIIPNLHLHRFPVTGSSPYRGVPFCWGVTGWVKVKTAEWLQAYSLGPLWVFWALGEEVGFDFFQKKTKSERLCGASQSLLRPDVGFELY